MYNDFLGEVIAEETRTGRSRKPDRNNPVTKQRVNLDRKIRQQARELGRPLHDIAIEYVTSNIGDIQRYVTENGEQPLSNPAELATQAYLLRLRDVNKIKKTLGVSDEEAELYLDEAESKAQAMNTSEADNFIGGLLAVLAPVAQKGAEKIAADRASKGKKPGFWGFLAGNQQDDNNAAANAAAAANAGYGLKVAAQDVFEAIKKEEKRKEINKMLPLIIGGVVALIVITALIARRGR